MKYIYTNINELVNERIFTNKEVYENLQFFVFALVGFTIPLLLEGPQLLTGAVVNLTLVLASLNITGFKRILPLVMLPSIAAFLRGFLFGPATVFLLYMIPFIWIGNFLLVLAFKHFFIKKKMNYVLTLGAGALIKSAFLFASAYVLVSFSVLPLMFLTAMGLIQLYTAVIGGLIAFPLFTLFRKYLC
ncbi:hypothetical protein JXB01_00085 [Candidatus Micrarchaeota archaeon]|nr:hypothetical protein [Candidatus Micrarchaeota archaeon]